MFLSLQRFTANNIVERNVQRVEKLSYLSLSLSFISENSVFP